MAPRSTPRLQTLARALGGDPGELQGRTVVRVTRAAIGVSAILSHLGGIVVLILLLAFGLPLPDDITKGEAAARLGIFGGGYALLVLPFAVVQGVRLARGLDDWLVEDRPPTDAERARTLGFPRFLLRRQAAFWAFAVVLFVAVFVPTSPTYAYEVAVVTALVGAGTTAIALLLCQFTARAVVARLLQHEGPRREELVSVSSRALSTWVLGSAVPAAGVLVLGVSSFVLEIESQALARGVVALAITALVVGLGSTLLFARSVAGPLEQLRDALEALDRGDLEASVPVADVSEVGYAQAGFNRAIAGLRERERMRDLFGRHVGEDVARLALEESVELGGEEREAAALFVDIVGSTQMAVERDATDVVERLNEFFAVVVDVTTQHGGLVNKFQGDAALCIFGAPLRTDDPAGSALAAARDLAARLAEEIPQVPAGIGVSAGIVVAGNVGAADRFEYTVIGDPVNEAARLTELAKDRPGRVAASEAAVTRASPEEAARWVVEDGVVLRGRAAQTRVARPKG